ncbi:Uncharacterised protein [Streptococcus pneumoniae]|nr:Uncharacterised protein [Streptococcus pneumoniae]CIV82230.1 Uncharacterised protein [Streptococcus pneumoniae]
MRFYNTSEVIGVGNKFFIAFYRVAFVWIVFISLKHTPTFSICRIIGIFIKSDVEDFSLFREISSILVDKGFCKSDSLFVVKIDSTG